MAVAAPWADVACAVFAVAALVLAAVLLTRSVIAPWLAFAVVALGLLALACAAVLAMAQPAVVGVAPGPLPGLRMAANRTYPLTILAVLVVLPVHCLGGWRKGAFFAGPFVAVAIGVVLLNGVGIGTMIRIADLLGTVANPGSGVVQPADPLFVFEGVYAVTPYLTAYPMGFLVLFALYEAFTLWNAARPSRRRRILADYCQPAAPDPLTVWDRSAFEEELHNQANPPRGPLAKAWRQVRRSGWAARTARGQRLSRIPHDADKALAIMAFAALGLVGWFWFRFLTYHQVPQPSPRVLTISTWLAAAVPIAVLLLMRSGWRGLNSRRRLGVLWDVGTFWPRAYHPLAPAGHHELVVGVLLDGAEGA